LGAGGLLVIFEITTKTTNMKKTIFKLLSKANKKLLPSYTKKELDLQKASKAQKALIGWKAWVTKILWINTSARNQPDIC
jgi:hypothetical protein